MVRWNQAWLNLAREFDGEIEEWHADIIDWLLVRIRLAETDFNLTYRLWQERGAQFPNEARSFSTVAMPFAAKSDFSFSIYNRDVIKDIGKVFGMQDIEIGDAAFDREYIIQGSDQSMVLALLASTALREMISESGKLRLEVQSRSDQLSYYKGIPNDVHVVWFLEHGAVESAYRLHALHNLMSLMLEELCRLKVASVKAPSYKLEYAQKPHRF